MTKNIQLLKHVRNAVAKVNTASDNSEHKTLLTGADYILNELMLQDSVGFYLQYIKQGKALLVEGMALAARAGQEIAQSVGLRNDLDEEFSIAVIHAEIDKLHQSLLAVVDLLDEGGSVEEKAYMVRLSEWESSLYNHRLEQVAGSNGEPARAITADALLSYLRKKFPQWRDLRLTKFMPLDGGFSKKTILFEIDDAVNGIQSMVVRAEQPANFLCFEGCDVTQEYKLIQFVRNAGLPIAEPLWLEADRSQLGTRFIVSRKAEGKTWGNTLGGNEPLSAELVQSIIATFIKLHNTRIDAADPLVVGSHLKEWLPYKSISDNTRYLVKESLPRRIRASGMPLTPLLQRGLKWLEKNIPDSDEAPVLIHIDFALNNLIIDNDAITAVLDWESSRIGDPAEDIVWTQQNLAAYITMPEFLKLYKAGTGRDISEYRMAYSRVVRCAGSAISCLSAMHSLDVNDEAHITLSILAYKYMALFGARFNSLIAEAEKLR